MKTLEIKSVGKFVISKQLQAEIDYLHESVGEKEWSGILMYTTEGKDVSKMENLVFVGKHLYLMDIGSGGSTEFGYDNAIVDMYDSIPEMIDDNIGIIHSHHSMGAFHSATDLSDLEKNASVYNYYISLVVSYSRKYVCKIAFPSKTKVTREVKIINTDGSEFTKRIEENESCVLISSLSVEFENVQTVNDWFSARYKNVSLAITARNNKAPYFNKLKEVDNGTKIISNSYKLDKLIKEKFDRQEDIKFDKNDSNDLSFATSIIVGDTVYCDKIADLLKALKGLKNSKMVSYISNENFDIIHSNIYGGNCDISEIRKHIDAAIRILGVYEKNYTSLRYIIDDLYLQKLYLDGQSTDW